MKTFLLIAGSVIMVAAITYELYIFGVLYKIAAMVAGG